MEPFELRTFYAATYAEKTACEDSFENGCSTEFNTIFAKRINIAAESLPALIAKLREEFFIPDGEKAFRSADEDEPAIQFTTTETNDGMEPSDREMEAFRRGEFKLWVCDYRFHVEKRIVGAVSVAELEASGIGEP